MEAARLVILFCLVIMAEMVRANIAEYDDVWRMRAKEAKRRALAAYHTEPEEVTEHLNYHVREAMEGNNTTRRGLRVNWGVNWGFRVNWGGACKAMNPIDRCWRCRPDWASDRKRLADCVLGFGRKTTGGKDGPFYVVTDSSDDDLREPTPGTLRHAVTRDGPLWIVFAHSMNIRLNEELIVSSDKTIDGRGANVIIANGAGITLQFVHNVIIHGIQIHNIHAGGGGIIRDSATHLGLRTASDGDGITLFGSTNIWLDHITMSNCEDGLIDIIEGSTAVTVSNCYMTHHNDVMLFGARPTSTMDTIMQVTIAFNRFGKGLVQRMPRCRFGFFHVVNNDYSHWLMYAIGGSENPTIISQGNRYNAPFNPFAKEVTKRPGTGPEQWKDWTWRSEGDLMLNGAFFVESGNPSREHHFTRYDMITAKQATFVTRLTRYSGALSCYENTPC